MTATNHALTGAILGAFLPLPVAIPTAFASHFVLDALPHYGIPHELKNLSLKYKRIVLSDTVIASSLAVIAAWFQKWNMEIAAWAAYSPDITWVVYYFRHDKDLHFKPTNRFMLFHRSIQICERPWGIVVELLLACAMMPIVVQQLLK